VIFLRKYGYPSKQVLCHTVFPENSLTAFSIHLAQSIDLTSSDWEVGLTEISYKAPNRKIMQGAVVDVVSSINVPVYCDLISLQFVGTGNVLLLRTIICSHNWETTCFKMFTISPSKKLFQDIRIELREANGEPAAFEDSIILTKVVLHF